MVFKMDKDKLIEKVRSLKKDYTDLLYDAGIDDAIEIIKHFKGL